MRVGSGEAYECAHLHRRSRWMGRGGCSSADTNNVNRWAWWFGPLPQMLPDHAYPVTTSMNMNTHAQKGAAHLPRFLYSWGGRHGPYTCIWMSMHGMLGCLQDQIDPYVRTLACLVKQCQTPSRETHPLLRHIQVRNEQAKAAMWLTRPKMTSTWAAGFSFNKASGGVCVCLCACVCTASRTHESAVSARTYIHLPFHPMHNQPTYKRTCTSYSIPPPTHNQPPNQNSATPTAGRRTTPTSLHCSTGRSTPNTHGSGRGGYFMLVYV